MSHPSIAEASLKRVREYAACWTVDYAFVNANILLMATIITVAGLKGGIGKSVTALHLAAYLERKVGEGSTLLVDGDPNGTILDWGNGGGLPVPVVSEMQAMRRAQDYEYAVLDTKARPEPGYLEELADGSDFMVLPTEPSLACLRVLMQTVQTLSEHGRTEDLRALLTIVPPWPNRDGERARRTLGKAGVPMFSGEINRRQVLNKAIEDGVPVYNVRERTAAKAWDEYAGVGEELSKLVGIEIGEGVSRG